MNDKEKAIILQNYDSKHLRNLMRQKKVLDLIYDSLAKEAAKIGKASGFDDPDAEFHFEDYPQTRKLIDKLIAEYVEKVEATIVEGNKREWLLANEKNKKLVNKLAKGTGIAKETIEGWTAPHLDALDAFQGRKVAGMGLSERVWNLSKQTKQELELALDVGLGEGKSAAELSRDVRGYLNEPKKLFRRVRDKHGNLRLSKAAEAYHPGQGVYRSSYKNALRMTATENNMAYRTSDHTSWQQLDFVIGQRVQLSNNHTIKNAKGKLVPLTDICDSLKGDYPKDFKFTGWHPFCRCIVTPILADWNEQLEVMKKQMNGEDVSNHHYKGEVTDVPEGYKTWMADNAKRIASAKSMPYFIKDNYVGGMVGGSFKWNKTSTQTLSTNSSLDSDKTTITSFVLTKTDITKLTDDELRQKIQDMQGNGLFSLNTPISAMSRSQLNYVYDYLIKSNNLPYKRREALIDSVNKTLSKVNVDTLSDFEKSSIAEFITQYQALEKSKNGVDIYRANNALEAIDNFVALHKKKVDFTKVSKYTPVELLSKGKWLGTDTTLDKKLFDTLGEYIPVKIVSSGTTNFSPLEYLVTLGKGDSRYSSISYRRKCVYHEYGHAIDKIKGLCTMKEVKDLMDKYNKLYSDSGEAKYKSLDIELVKKQITATSTSGLVQYGVTDKNDIIWQFNAFSDTIQSLYGSTAHGTTGGHFTQGYWSRTNAREKEFLAHCFENAYEGNAIYKEFDKSLYDETLLLLKTILK